MLVINELIIVKIVGHKWITPAQDRIGWHKDPLWASQAIDDDDDNDY